MRAFAGSAYFIRTVATGHVRRPARLLLAAIMLLVAAGSLVMIPVTVRDAVEAFTSAPNGELARLDAQPFLLLGTCALVWIISSSLTNYLHEDAIDRTVMAARLALYRNWLMREPGANDARIGIISRITSDSAAFQAGLAAFSRDVPLALLQMLGALIFMAATSLPLTAAFIICLAAVGALLSLSEARLISMSRQVNRCSREITSLAVEVLNNVRWIQRFGQEDNEVARYDRSQQALKENLERRRRFQLIGRMLVYLGLTLSLGGMAALGLALVRLGSLTAGDIVAFLGLGLIIGSSIVSLLDANSAIAKAVDPLRRLSEHFPGKWPDCSAEPLRLARGPVIEIANLIYEPEAQGGKPFRLSIERMRIPAAGTVAFVGASGSGKSSLLKLIAGEQRAREGTIRLNGQDVSTLARGDLIANVAYFDSIPLILSRTLRENILFGQPRDELEVEKVIEAAQLAELVGSLPLGMETALWFGQEGLSSGQRQRIAFARSLLVGAKVLLLDEALAAIDSAAEREVISAVSRLYFDATKIIVSHRLSSVRAAGTIFVFDAGRIVETGTHDELVARRGAYHRLFRDQIDRTDKDLCRMKMVSERPTAKPMLRT